MLHLINFFLKKKLQQMKLLQVVCWQFCDVVEVLRYHHHISFCILYIRVWASPGPFYNRSDYVQSGIIHPGIMFFMCLLSEGTTVICELITHFCSFFIHKEINICFYLFTIGSVFFMSQLCYLQ